VFCHVSQQAGAPQWFNFAATDGHRLARKRIEVSEGMASWGDVILPRKAVGLLGKLLAESAKADAGQVVVSAAADAARLQFEMPVADSGSVRLVTKAIDGTFPDYTRVIPTQGDKRAVIDREGLLAALARVSVMSIGKTRSVRCDFSEARLVLTVSEPETGEGREEVPCDYQGEAFTIGFNSDYWREVLSALASDNVLMIMSESNAPSLVVSADAEREAKVAAHELGQVQVLMPMRPPGLHRRALSIIAQLDRHHGVFVEALDHIQQLARG